MTMQHSGWRASRNRTLNHFEVLGLITKPDEQQPDSTSMVTTGISLLKLDHQPLLPSILILRLYVAQEAALAAAPGLGWRFRLWDRLRISNVTVTCICDTRHPGMGVCAGLPHRCLWHSYRNYICNSISNRCQRGLHRCQLLPDKLA